jgi:hypothetical protein
MNINTFRDAVQSRKGALVNEVQDDDDDEREVAMMRRPVEGEEEDGKEKVNFIELSLNYVHVK